MAQVTPLASIDGEDGLAKMPRIGPPYRTSEASRVHEEEKDDEAAQVLALPAALFAPALGEVGRFGGGCRCRCRCGELRTGAALLHASQFTHFALTEWPVGRRDCGPCLSALSSRVAGWQESG